MTERIGLEAVFDERDFDRGISRYMSLLQEATDLTELAASSIGDALKSIGAGANLSAISDATQAVGQAFDALALNTSAAADIASLAIRGLATDTIDATKDIAGSVSKATEETSFAVRALATDTSDAAIKTQAAAERLADGVSDSLGRIPPAVDQIGDVTKRLPAQVTPPLEQTKEKIGDVGDEAEKTRGRVSSAFGGITQAISVAQPGIDFFREVTVGAFREVGAIITNEIQNALQNLRAFAGEVLYTAAAQTPLIDTLTELKEKMAGVTLVSLEPLFTQLDTLVQKAEPAFLSVLQSAETYLGQVASNAFAWGENITGQLASGMIAAISSVISALADIGNLIAFYLMPGSPPRLLPDIDDWGTETAQVWMDGWGKVDFGVFDQISGTIESLIRSLPLGEDSGQDVISRILGSREGIAAAVEELRTAGAISEQTISSIVGSVGAASEEVSGYIRSLAALTAANENLQAAQDELNRVTKEYDDLLKPIDSALDSIDEAQRQLTDANRISQLELVANDPGAALAEKEQARLEIEKIRAEQKKRALLAEKKQAIDNAQVAVDAAKEAQAQAQDEFDANKAKIDALTEQNRLLQEQLRLQQELEKPAAGGGGGGKPSGIKLPPIGGFGDPLGDLFAPIEQSLAGLQSAFNTAFAAIAQTLQPATDAFVGVQDALGNLVSAFAESTPRIKMYIADAVAFVVRELGINLPTIFDNVASILNTLADVWRNHGDTIMAVVNFAWRAIVATIGVSITAVSTIIATTLNQISGIMDAFSALLNGNWTAALAIFLNATNESLALIQQAFTTILDAILAIFNTSTAEIQVLWEAGLTAIKEFSSDTWNGILEVIQSTWKEIESAVGDGIEAAKGVISDSVSAFSDLGGNIIDGIKAGIEGAVGGLAAAAAQAALSALDAAKAALGIESPSKEAAKLVGRPFVQGIEMGVSESIPSLQRTVKVASGAMLGAGAGMVSNTTNISRPFTFAPQYNSPPPAQTMDYATAFAMAPAA